MFIDSKPNVTLLYSLANSNTSIMESNEEYPTRKIQFRNLKECVFNVPLISVMTFIDQSEHRFALVNIPCLYCFVELEKGEKTKYT